MAGHFEIDAEDLFILSLDFEIFFGSRPGSVENCLILPTEALLEIANRTGLRLSLFVDAGYISKLDQLQRHHVRLRNDYEKIAGLLKKLVARGHDVQLHIHPHWGDSTFNGDNWQFDYTHYRLQSFTSEQITEVVAAYKTAIENLTEKGVFAYRAGGWCLQPFDVLASAFRNQGIWLDSTLFRGGYNPDPHRFFDFREMPHLPKWRFDDDPMVVAEDGYFIELPISEYPISPLIFWKMAVSRKLWPSNGHSFGDGEAMTNEARYYLRRLILKTASPVSIDGIKCTLLENALSYHREINPNGVFNVMGHPKSLTRQSISVLEEFLIRHRELQSATFTDLVT